jgi:hypothetical protein
MYRYDKIFLIAAIPTLFIAGGFVYSLVVAGVPLSGVRLAQLSLIWWIGSALAIASMVYPGWAGNLVVVIMVPIALMLATLSMTGLLLRASFPSLRWISTLGGWAIALIGGIVVINFLLYKYDVDALEAAELSFGLVGVVVGAVGGGWMYRQLRAFSVPMENTASSPMAVLVVGLGWGIAWAVLGPLVNSGQIFLGAVIPALFMAAGIAATVNIGAGKRVSRVLLGQLFALWWVGIALALVCAILPDWQGYLIEGVVLPIALLLATFAGSGLLLHASIPQVSWASILGGLALGVVAGAIATTAIRLVFPYEDLHLFGLHDLGGAWVLGLGGLVGGLISGGWMRRQLSQGRSDHWLNV